MSINRRSLSCTTMLLFLAVGVKTTHAQDIAGGLETQRPLAALAESPLPLLLNGARAEFAKGELQINARDSRLNGTMWGLAVGGALGLWLENAVVNEYGRDDVNYGSVAVPVAAVGAGIGFTVDHFINRNQMIYRVPRSTTVSTTVSAVWNRRQKGVTAALRF
jgi:hypothetical protein